MLNTVQKRGILFDILSSKKINLSKNTIVNPLTLDQVASEIYSYRNDKGIIEIGSTNSISLGKFASMTSSNSQFKGKKYNLTSNQPKKKIDMKKLFNECFFYLKKLRS